MNTRKYDSKTRKQMKREQRSPEYVALQQRTAAERSALQAKLSQREKPLHEKIAILREASGSVRDEWARFVKKNDDASTNTMRAHSRWMSRDGSANTEHRNSSASMFKDLTAAFERLHEALNKTAPPVKADEADK